MPGFLPNVVGVIDSEGNRVDQPDQNGDHSPIMLKIGTSMSATATNNGAITEVLLESTGGGGGGSVIALADHAAFRALTSAPDDKTVINFKTPPSTYIYSSTSGAGFPDDDNIVLKRTGVLDGVNGRAYNATSAILPTYAAYRLIGGLGLYQSYTILARSSIGDGGGGVFAYDSSDVTTADDDGITLVSGTHRAKRIFAGSVHVEWFGAVADLVSHATGGIAVGSTTFTDPSGVFTSADVGKPILFVAPQPGSQATGTIATTASGTTIVGTGTAFLSELKVGDAVGYLDNGNSYLVPTRVASVTDNTHFETDSPVYNTLTGKTLYRRITWQTTIAGFTSATTVTLAQASVARLDKSAAPTFPLFRYIYGTNNVAAFQAAANTGKEIHVPAKAFGISGTVSLATQSIYFRGEGWMRRHYDFYGTDQNIRTDSVEGSVVFQFAPDSPMFTSSGANYLKLGIKDLAFRGPGSGTVTVVDTHVGLTTYCNFDHCLAFNMDIGWDHSNTLEGTFSRLEAFACGTGFRVGPAIGSLAVTDSVWLNANAQDCGVGILIEQCSKCHFLGGTVQANVIALALYAKNYPGGVDGVTFSRIWCETYQKALDIRLNGIFHTVTFDRMMFAAGVTFQPVNAGQGVIDKVSFHYCDGDLKTVDAPDVTVIGLNTEGTRMGSPAFTYAHPEKTFGMVSSGGASGGLLYSFGGAATDKNAGLTIAGSWSPVWSDGIVRAVDVSGNVTVNVPSNAPIYAPITFIFHKTALATITMAAGFKGPYDDSGSSGSTSLVSYMFDGTNWILQQQNVWSPGTFSPPLGSSATLTATTPLTVNGVNTAVLLSSNPTVAVAGATTGATGVVKLAQDLGGTALLPTVVAITGTSGTAAIHATTLQADTTQTLTLKLADDATASAGTAPLLKFQGANATAGTRNGGPVELRTGTSAGGASGTAKFYVGTSLWLNADGGSVPYVQIVGNSGGGGGIFLDANTYHFRTTSAVDKGVWDTTGLRIGDGNTPTHALEVAGTIFVEGTSVLFKASVAGPLIGQQQAASGSGVTTQVFAQSAAAASNGNGGNLQLIAGVKDGAGTDGTVQLQAGGATVVTVATTQVTLAQAFLTFAASVTGPLISQATNNTDGFNFTVVAQGAGSGTNKSGGNIVLDGGAGTGTGIQGGVIARLGSGEQLIQVVSLAGAAGVSTKSIVALCRKTPISLTQVPDGDGLVYIGDATVVPVTQPVSGIEVYSKAGRPTFWGSNTGPASLELSLPNTLGGAIVLTGLTSTDSLNIFLGGTSYRIPLI